MSRNSSLRVFAAVAVLLVVAAACSSNKTGGGSSSGAAGKTVKLAFMGALTGAASQAVIPGYQGASLAIDEANAGKFGKLPVKIEIVQEDTQGSATQGHLALFSVIQKVRRREKAGHGLHPARCAIDPVPGFGIAFFAGNALHQG